MHFLNGDVKSVDLENEKIMKKSMFNISQSIENGILLYNTFTTSLVELSEDLYQSIFVEGDFSSPEIHSLYDMGFLVDDACDEILTMENIRRNVLEHSSEKIANIIIAPTLECNAHCFYCFENGFRNGRMSIETADALVEFLKQRWNGDKLGITWFGGEPLLASDIIDYISSKLRENNIIYGCKITTNGSLFSKDIAQKAISLWNVEKVQITIDAVGEEYNRIKNYDKQYENAFSLVMQNITDALSLGINIKVRINFDPDRKNKALDIMNYLLGHFENSSNLKIYFAPIDADDEIVKNISNEFEEYDEHPYIALIKFGREHHLYKGFPDMEDDCSDNHEYDTHGLLKKLKMYPSPINCYATCPNVFSIGPDGDIYKCHRALGRKDYASGNVRTGIEENDAYRFFCNTELTYDECTSCAILPICQGGCKINAQFYCGKEACAPSKAIIKDLIILYREDMSKIL